MTLELERPREPRVCKLCGDAVADVCPRCGVDKRSGDLVHEPVPPPAGPARDGARPLRRRAAALLAIPKSTRQWLARGLRESLEAWPATLLCLAVVGIALSVQRIPTGTVFYSLGAATRGSSPFAWPGQLLASFILAFLAIEHARGAREGHKGALDAKGAFDPSSLGTSLLMALLLLPLFAGPFLGNPVVAVLAGVPFTLVFPAFLGALVTDSAEELALPRLKEALFQSPHYLRTTLVAMTCLVGALAAVWLPSEQAALWRAPVAVAGATLAGTLSGLLRRDAETMIDDDEE